MQFLTHDGNSITASTIQCNTELDFESKVKSYEYPNEDAASPNASC